MPHAAEDIPYTGRMKPLRVVALVIAGTFSGACQSKVDTAHETCVKRETDKIMKQAESAPALLKDTLEKDGHKLAEGVCAPIKSFCKDDEESTMCKQMIEKLGGK